MDNATPVYDRSGRWIAPPQTRYTPRPQGPWDENAPQGPEFSVDNGSELGVEYHHEALAS